MVTLFNFQRCCLVIALCLFFAAPTGAGTRADGVEAVISPLAVELLKQIDTWRTDRGAGRLRVAIWPTRKQSEIPVPLVTARTFDEALLSSLMSIRPKWLTIIGRKELASVIENQQERTGNFADALKFVAKNSAVDILLIPVVQIDAGITTLGYKAVSAAAQTAGEIIAKTMAHKIAQRSTSSELTIEQAVAQAVEKFSEFASDVNILYLGPISFESESTNCQTKLSQYIQERMSEGLTDRFASVLTGRKVILHNREPNKNSPKVDGTYVLMGTYWDLSGTIDLRLTLRQWPNGQTVSWSGRVRLPNRFAISQSYILIFEGFTSEEIFDVEELLVTFCGYASHRPVRMRNRRSEYFYTTTSGGARLTNNIREMSKLLGLPVKISFSENKFSIRKLNKRKKKYNWTK
jgi:hypothetical protein|tara:strand:+ start:1443 stop:2660 length:1218 start_codon:yes stop_codon:yes gene_type:complete